VRVFEPLGLPGDPLPEWVEAFEQGLHAMRREQWKAAVEHFARVPGDTLSQRYLKRCLNLLDGSEPTWDGIWNLTEK
jgi:hypothetical protein